MRLKPIAVVRNGVSENIGDWDSLVSRLVFEPEYVQALYGIERRRHIWVIFGFHRKRGWSPLIHPRGDPKRPMMGVFATRSPRRPNRIGLTRVELLQIRGRTVTVRGLDALDGSPVWDIKPDEGELRAQRRAAPRKTR
jgi:tRNA-Thr(GGU) m(6)t(6)A37 methyltransferase TsaA